MCEYSQRIGKWVTEAEGRTGSQLVINVRVCQHFCLNFFFSVHSAASAVSAPWRDLSVTPWACCPRQAHDPKAQQAGRKVCAPHLPGSGSVRAGILTSGWHLGSCAQHVHCLRVWPGSRQLSRVGCADPTGCLSLWRSHYLTHGETGAQRGTGICPKPPSWSVPSGI